MTIAIQTRVKFNDTNQRLLKKFEQLEGNDYDDCYSNSSQIQWYDCFPQPRIIHLQEIRTTRR